MTKHHKDEVENAGLNHIKKDQAIHTRVKERIAHIKRKLSRGASNLYKMLRSREKWGNKQIKGHLQKKNHHKPQ